MNDSPKSPKSIPLHAGDQLGAYHIVRRLGSGGMAEVFYAMHEGLQRPAAVKVLRASLAADDIHLQRFMKEARSAASLVHPNIVQVYDVGQEGEHRYIAQEFIPGSNLRQYLALGNAAEQETSDVPPAAPAGTSFADRQLSVRETLSILLQVLAALNKSSASGIVHRDIKPENIMLTQDGEVKVADFGLARTLLSDDPQLTRAGTTLGTPMYMSPEQIQEQQVDIRSDLYSLGVTLYHMLTGRPPFMGETPLALAMQHVQAPVPDLTQFRDDLPASLIELVTRLLAKSPSKRFRDPQQVLDFLRSQRGGELSEHWPDQTVPLPGVALANAGGPMQATLVLQSKLRKKRWQARKKVLTLLAIAAFWLTTFGLGALFAFSTPLQLFESTSESYRGIERQNSVEEQYRWALLNSESSPRPKWEAVGHFFPKQDGPLNRYYVGLASLQLAREHLKVRDVELARNELQRILNDDEMDAILKALAHLQLAEIEERQERETERDAQVDLALELCEGDKISRVDKQRLDNNVRLMSQLIQDRWFLSRPQSALSPQPGFNPSGFSPPGPSSIDEPATPAEG